MIHIVLAIVLGTVIGLTLGALGAGGSILAVPVLVHIVGLPVPVATATSLVAVGSAALAAGSTRSHRSNVRWDVAISLIVAGTFGAIGGAAVGRHLNGDILLLAFSGLIFVAAYRMLTACPSCTRVGEERALADGSEEHAPAPLAERAVVFVLAGVGVGFLTGLFGVGGGFVIVPVLTLVLGLAMPPAIGTSLVVVAGNAAVALVVRGAGAVDWPKAVAFTVPMLVGSLIGAAVAKRLHPQKSLRAFATVLILVAIANALSVLV